MLLQRLIVTVFAVLMVFIVQANSAYADINCFPQGTKISAPNGDLSIEDLHSGDLIIGYSFDSNKEVNYTVQNTSQKSNIGSFFINNTIKSSGNNLVYLYPLTKHRITTVHKLQKYRHILSRSNQDFEIDSIRHIVDASECIQIALEEEQSNFYANKILFYGKREIQKNFKQENFQDPIACRYSSCLHLNSKTITSILITLITLSAGILLSAKVIDMIQNLSKNK